VQSLYDVGPELTGFLLELGNFFAVHDIPFRADILIYRPSGENLK
jgi:hypothetical protein